MTNRVRLLPSCVFICLSALNLAQLRILSMIADFETESNVSLHTNREHYSQIPFLMNSSERVGLLPNLAEERVNCSFV